MISLGLVMIEWQRILRGSGLLLLASIVARGSMLFFRYIAALTISIEDYGRLSLYISLFLSMATIAGFGVGGSLAKLGVKTEGDRDAQLSLHCNAVILIFGSSTLATILFVLALGKSSPELMTKCIITLTAIGLICWGYFQISIGFCLAEFKFNLASYYEGGDGLIKLFLILSIIIFLGKPSIITFIISFCLGYVLLSLLAFYNNFKFLGNSIYANPLKLFNLPQMSKLFRHSSSLMLISFTTIFYGFILRSFLATSSTSNVALFDMAMTFYSIPRMIFSSLVRPVVPYMSKNSKNTITIPNKTKIIVFFSLLLVIAILLHQTGITKFILNKLGLAIYTEAFPLFLILMSSALFDLWFGFLSSCLQGIGKVGAAAILTIGTFIFTLPISYYAISLYGTYGAALSQVVFTTVLAILTSLVARRLLHFKRT